MHSGRENDIGSLPKYAWFSRVTAVLNSNPVSSPELPLHVLVVHSSAELYGSDRSLLDFVRHCGSAIKVTVALPEQGILIEELERAGASVIVGEVSKIQRSMLSVRGIFGLLRAAWRSVAFLDSARPDGGFDLVYSNTVAVLGGALYARRRGIPHVWHVREILAGSSRMTAVFRRVVASLSSRVLCNSGETCEWIRMPGSGGRYQVIWNGFDAPIVTADRRAQRQHLGVGEGDVLFVLVGRINAWKGQKLLVQAFAQLPAEIQARAYLAIVGSAPTGQEHYEQDLTSLISQSACAERVKLIPYRADIESIWVAADVAVVPSTEPEPFGRVAIEAMAFSLPVIAAAHGGLVEIVIDGETGKLVSPRDSAALASAMAAMARDDKLRQRMGSAGRVRQLELFSVASYASRLIEALRSTVAFHR